MDRRQFLQTSALTTAGLLLPAEALAKSKGSALLAAIRNPPASSRPQIRWWWPGGTIDAAEVAAEARTIAAAGFGGFEIADVRDSLSLPVDPATQGWGSPAWIAAVDAALEEAVRQGIAPSLTLGPHWPTGVPGVKPDDEAASKEMVHGSVVLAGGARYSGEVPPPVLRRPSGLLDGVKVDEPITSRLLAVQALRLAGDDATLLDFGSLVDLLPMVREGRLDWQAPSEGTWQILSFWMRGTGQLQNLFGMNPHASMLAAPTPYVLDIYGPAAVDALTRYWDNHLLPEKTRSLLRKAGGTFFEDSLELSFACPWTPTALDEFARRRGYELTPFLALLVSRQPTFNETILGGSRPALFRFKAVDGVRVRHDFDSLLSELYVENRVAGLSRWAAGHGLRFRVQAIGSEINAGLAAATAPIPEGDNSNDIHGWRRLAAGRDIGGATLLSDEAATFVKGNAHVATWRDALYMIHRDMVGGANQIVLHGYSYAAAPGAKWPGFSAFGRAIGNDWGPRDPNWTMAKGVTTYLGRLQHLLRQGRTQSDLAVLGQPLRSQTVLQAGYTFQYPEMELFALPQMSVVGGRLMPEGPAYRAVVLHAVEAMDADIAERLLDHAGKRLPVVVVGEAPRRARGWRDAAADDHRVVAAFAKLLRLGNVRQVQTQRQVPAALLELGVQSRIRFTVPCRVLALHRRCAEGELVYLLNDSPVPVEQMISLALPGTPHRVDLWDGELVAVPEWQRTRDGSQFRLVLAPDEAAVLLLATQTFSGSVSRTDQPTRAEVPLLHWNVELDSWLPGETPATTRHGIRHLMQTTLKPWSEWPDGKGMAGTATYRTTWSLESGSTANDALIDLGLVKGTATVSINGSSPRMVNPYTAKVRVGPWLKPGENVIEITVASPLNNRLLAEGIQEQGFKPPMGDASAAKPPPLPVAALPVDPDLIDGPGGGMGMQPGAAPPGSAREFLEFGLLGPVVLRM